MEEKVMLRTKRGTAADLGLLGLRVVTGGLMAGHGAQKLFGVLGGYGIPGTAGWLESLGLKPGKVWAYMAGGGELGSGLLTVLGLVHPLGPLAMFGPMVTAWITVHAGKPIWTTAGGAELPVVYMSTATALALIGPGRYSLDEMLDIEIPTPIVALFAAGVVGGIVGSMVLREPVPQAQEDAARDDLQSGANAAASDEGSEGDA